MASLRSWIGSVLSLLAFVVTRRFTTGLAAPTFVVIIFSTVYIWTVVLRVPELSKFQPAVHEDGPAAAEAAEAADTAAPLPDNVGVRTDPLLAETLADAESASEVSSAAGGSSVSINAPTKAFSTAELGMTPTAELGARRPSKGAPEGVGSVKSEDSLKALHDPHDDRGGPSAHSKSRSMVRSKDSLPVVRSSSHDEEREGQRVRHRKSAPERVDSVRLEDSIRSVRSETHEDGRGGRDGSGSVGELMTQELSTGASAACTADTTSRAADAAARPKADTDNDSWASETEEDAEERSRREADAEANPERAQELRLEGNEFFKAGKLYDAREAYSEALYLTPSTQKKEKAILHCNRAACLQKLSRWEEVVSDCKAAIENDAEYVKAYSRRSIAHEAMEKWHDALEDLKKAIELEPSLRSSEYKRQAVLEKRAQEQFDKDKDEMMGKLKELGNTVLGKFGMSCDNFQMVQDPETGSYSIKYSQ